MPADPTAPGRGSPGTRVAAGVAAERGLRLETAGESRVVEFWLGDLVRLRRAHPCGSHEWTIDRLGADIGLRCGGCGRHVMMDRRTVERRLAGFISRGDEAMTRAVAPRQDGSRPGGGSAESGSGTVADGEDRA